MKLKKFFAGVVAAAMMLTMGATAAFAAAPADTIDVPSIDITKHYTEAAGTTAPAESFKFVQMDKEVVHKSVFYNDASKIPDLILTNTKAEFNGANDGKLTIVLPEYQDVGVFRYTIEEQATNGKIQGVTYNLKRYYVNVYSLRDDTTGRLFRKVNVTNIEGNQKAKVEEITSSYDAGSLTVTKNVTGALGDKNQDFVVTVEFTAANNEEVLSQINASTTRAGGILGWEVKEGTNVVVEGNGKAFTLKDGKTAKVTFKIKDSETITFNNIPGNVTCKVAENDYSTAAGTGDEYGYTTTYENKESTTTVEGNKTVSAVITNTKGADIDTGVILDNAPYIALLAIVVFGGVALMLNKRRRDEE